MIKMTIPILVTRTLKNSDDSSEPSSLTGELSPDQPGWLNEEALAECSCQYPRYGPLSDGDKEELVRFYEELSDPLFGRANLDFLLRLIDDGPPRLPNFGVFYLTVAQAAALIAGDLEASSRYPFDSVREAKPSDEDREKWVKGIREKLGNRFESRMMEAVRSGAIASEYKREDLRGFVEGKCHTEDPTRTYIPYLELIDWLVRSGYTSRVDMDDTLPGLGNYGCVEYSLACEIHGYIEMRRTRCGNNGDKKELQECDRQSLQAMPRSFSSDEYLASALSEIQELEDQVRLARHSQPTLEERPLETKERESLHKVILALWKVSSLAFNSRGIVSEVGRNLALLGLGLSDGTIRTRLTEARRLLAKR
jgi:hypothetical protein